MLNLGAAEDFSCSASLWFCPLLGFATQPGWQEQVAEGQWVRADALGGTLSAHSAQKRV